MNARQANVRCGVNRDRAGQAAGPAMSRNAPLATVGPKRRPVVKAMTDRLHCGKPEPFRLSDRCEVDRGARFEACYLAHDCSGNAPAGERSNGNRHRKTSINMRARQCCGCVAACSARWEDGPDRIYGEA
jgi:hypothetical protein